MRITFAALDGYELGGTVINPHDAPSGAVLISGAVAAPHKIYRPISAALAEAGFAVLSYDYRGIGASHPGNLRGFKATMADWARYDMGGAVRAIRERYPDLPLVGLGHSFGGQALGLQPAPNIFKRYAAVATLSGYYRGTDEPWRIFFSMNAVGVPMSHLFGYMPGRLSGFGTDLPAGVFRQWAKWCRNPNYLFDDPGLPEKANFTRYNHPYLAIGLKDDPWGTPRALHGLLRHYDNADIEEWWLDPSQSPLGQIGHFGFFRKENAALWTPLIDWLSEGLAPR